MRNLIKKAQQGFTLVELLLVLSIIVGLATLELSKLKAQADQKQGETAGVQMAKANKAFATYVEKKKAALQRMGEPGGDPACTVVAGNPNVCQLDLNILKQFDLVPLGWEPKIDGIRSDLVGQVRRFIPPAGAFTTADDYSIEAVLFTNGSWRVGGDPASFIETRLLNLAAKNVGSMGGVSEGGGARGLFSAWQVPAGAYPGLNDGQLVAVSNVQANIANQFVRLDGSLPMTGNLNMSDYRINNARDMELLGPTTLRRNQNVSSLMPSYVLKGVYNVVDFEADATNGVVPKPYCADSDLGSTGIPRILVRWSALYNDMYGGYSGGTPETDAALAIQNRSNSDAGWEIRAVEPDTDFSVWQIRIRKFYDAGYVAGEGLAEVYCYYP